MQENVGSIDRWIRLGVGAGLLVTGASAVGRQRIKSAALIALGTALIETSITRVCPMNAALGLDTRRYDRNGARRQLSQTHANAVGQGESIGAAQRVPADS